MSLNLTIFIATIHTACAMFQLITCLLHQRKLLASKYPQELLQNTFLSQKAFEFSLSIDLKATDKYIIFLACRFLTLCLGLLLFTFTQFPVHYHGVLACFTFLATIQGIYLLFTLPTLWKQSKLAVKNESRANFLSTFSCLLLLKIMQKLLLILIFVPFYRFIIEFLIFGTIFFFFFKLICASVTGWSVNDQNYANFDENSPIYSELLELCSKSNISIDKIYYEICQSCVADEKTEKQDKNGKQDLPSFDETFSDDDDEDFQPTLLAALTDSAVRIQIEESDEKGNEMDLFSGEMDSTETSSCSAYVYGIWRVKRLVLEKGILSLLTPSELIAICAHEIGHWQMEHNLYRFIFYYIQNFILFCLFKGVYLLRVELGRFFDLPCENLLFLMLVLLPVVPIYYRISDFCFNLMTRRQEFAADKYATKKGYGMGLIQALCKIYLKNKLSIDPHDIFSLFNVAQSHPPLLMRIRRIRALMHEKTQ